MYTALLFDLDNTLVDRDGAVRAHFAERLREYTLDRSDMLEEVLARDRSGYGDREAFLEWYQAMFAPESNQRELMIEMRFGLVRKLRAYRGVKTLLQRLSREYTLGLLTNGSATGQRLKLEATGLRNYFTEDVVSIAGEMNFSKPSPVAFEKALERIVEFPEDTLMIGDDPINDIQGGAEAGLSTCWISHGRTFSGPTPPTYVIEQVTDLPSVLVR